MKNENLSPQIRSLAQAAATRYAGMPPNSARAFSATVEILARGMPVEVAREIARKTLPGSHRAWREQEAGRQRRLERVARNGGRIN